MSIAPPAHQHRYSGDDEHEGARDHGKVHPVDVRRPGHVQDRIAPEAVRLGHPWYLDVRTGSPPLGPQHLAWMDAGMGILQQAGLGPRQAASGLLLVDGYVRSTIGFALQYGASPEADTWAERLRQVVTDESLPAVSAALEAGTFEDEPEGVFPDSEFMFGLGVLLDGIEGLL